MQPNATHHRSLCVTLAAFVVGVALFAAPRAALSDTAAGAAGVPAASSVAAPPSTQPPSSEPASTSMEPASSASTPSEPASTEPAPSEPATELAAPATARAGDDAAAPQLELSPRPRRNQLLRSQPEELSELPAADLGSQASGVGDEKGHTSAHCPHCVRRVSLVLGLSGGVGLPAKYSALESNSTQLVTGLSFASPGFFFSAAIPLNAHWELVPRFAAQMVWDGEPLTLVPSVELRARVFPGAPKRRWEEFFVFGVGYGELHHLVRVSEVPENGEQARRELKSAAAGPVRILAAMGARWNSAGRVGIDIEVTPYLLFPDWSVHVELSAGLVIKL